MSIQPSGLIDIIRREGQDEVPGPAFFIEIDAEDLSTGKGHFVEGEDHFCGGFGGGNAQPVGIPGEDGLFVLEAASGATLALHGEARVGQAIADRRAVAEGNHEEENVILVEDVFAEDFYPISVGADVEEFRFHTHNAFKLNRR